MSKCVTCTRDDREYCQLCLDEDVLDAKIAERNRIADALEKGARGFNVPMFVGWEEALRYFAERLRKGEV